MKLFLKILFCGFLGISLSTGRNAGRGKVAYSWMSPDPAKTLPTLGVVIVVVSWRRLDSGDPVGLSLAFDQMNRD